MEFIGNMVKWAFWIYQIVSRNSVILQLDPLALKFGLLVENGNVSFYFGRGWFKIWSKTWLFLPNVDSVVAHARIQRWVQSVPPEKSQKI